jgi:arginase family enzyme
MRNQARRSTDPAGPSSNGQTERGITSLFMHDVRDLGIREVVRPAVEAVRDGPVFMTVDVDVLDPTFVPGTGTPELDGMTAGELLLAVRAVAAELDLVGTDVVEVIPSARR